MQYFVRGCAVDSLENQARRCLGRQTRRSRNDILCWPVRQSLTALESGVAAKILMPLTLRPVAPSDQDFLFEVYASTRRDEVSAWGWDVTQQDTFLRMQFTAQQRSYEMQYANPSHDLILLEGEPIGRLLVARTSEEIHLVDISLVPAKRSNGIGTALILKLLDEGTSTGLPVRLEVLQTNPAVLLYERLGFVKVGENSFYFQMEKRPS